MASKVPESILAFSTITTLLSKIERRWRFDNPNDVDKNSKEQKLSKVLMAVADLFVRMNKIVATTMLEDDGKGVWNYIATANPRINGSIHDQ